MAHIICFIVSVILEWTACFALGASFKFKEEYKKYHTKLFDTNNSVRPFDWTISRQRNHDRYVLFKWLSVIFILIAVTIGCNLDNLVIVFMLTLALPPLIPFLLGKLAGKNLCKKSVEKECERFGMEFEKIWESLSKESSSIFLKIFYNVDFNIL